MKLVNNILIFLLVVIVFISSNGFIFEQYLCFDCETKRNDVDFFEFGELNHDHDSCKECSEHGYVCDCSQKHEEHEENSDVTYYSMEVLFSNNTKSELTPAIVFSYIDNLSVDLFGSLVSGINNSKFITLLKLIRYEMNLQYQYKSD